MKHAIIAVLAMGFSGAAMADGFKCETLDGVYSVKVMNHLQPEAGTRNAAIMIISDNTVQYGRKTIATFEDADSLLENEGSVYDAEVDLRYSNSDRGGENFLGTKLGYIDSIRLSVDFFYDQPVPAGFALEGYLWVTKRNGDIESAEMFCTRYLKN